MTAITKCETERQREPGARLNQVIALLFYALSILVVLLGFAELAYGEINVPTLKLDLSESDRPEDLIPAIKIVGVLTLLTVAPALMLMMTSFTRTLIVLSFVRQALGTQAMPPNQVIIGLSLFLTLFTMGPVLDTVKEQAFDPYVEKKIDQTTALERATVPLRKFMLAETRKEDLSLFVNISKQPKPSSPDQVGLSALIPAFMISELKTAFQMGFLVYIPFLIIDMVVSSILMAMGMMMLPPTVVSMPFKLVLFVLVDGWSLIASSIVKSFSTF